LSLARRKFAIKTKVIARHEATLGEQA
jgi:hypothetical protein